MYRMREATAEDICAVEVMFMRNIKIFLLLFLLAMGCFCMWNAETVHAEIASGTCGTCSWVIDDEGVLRISPTDGVSGTLVSYTTGTKPPWGQSSYASSVVKVIVAPGVKAGVGARNLFASLNACIEIDAHELDVSVTTNMTGMFQNCSVLERLDISGWDMNLVTTMGSMFGSCRALPFLDMSNFVITEDMYISGLFAGCSNLGELIIGPNVETLVGTTLSDRQFRWVRDDRVYGPYTGPELTEAYNSSMAGHWISDSAAIAVLQANGELVFCRTTNAYSNKTDYDEIVDIAGNVYSGKVYTGVETRMPTSSDNGMWTSQNHLVTSVRVADGQIIKPKSCYFWFYYCDKMTVCDLSGVDFSQVTRMDGFFSTCYGLETIIGLDAEDFGAVTSMKSMFDGCRALTALDLSGWDVHNVANMNGMFDECRSLVSLDLSGWDVRSVTDFGTMFSGCAALTGIDFSGWSPESALNMNRIFYRCISLLNLDIADWNTPVLYNLYEAFRYCSSLTELDLSGWDVSHVNSLYRAFSDCRRLVSLNLSGWHPEVSTTMYWMMDGCDALEVVNLDSWTVASCTSISSFFPNITSSTRATLREVTLGPEFKFTAGSTSTRLPDPPTSKDGVYYTGKWIREDGSDGPYTATELWNNYVPEMAGTWIWEERQVNYVIKFVASNGAAGAMPDQKIKADTAGTINPCEFYRFNYHFDHWDASDGRTYADGATIPKNRYAVGDVITLTAVFEKDDNHLGFDEGVAELTLHGGEKVTLPDLPGGASYQVWEETPAGWQLIEQTNAAGEIPANGTADSSFTNEYVPGTATISLLAQKTLDGRSPEDGQFTFELVRTDGTEPEVVETVHNNGAGMVTFQQLVFMQPGTFTYQIREVRGEDEAINYDSHVETVTITVSDDGAGNLTAVSSLGTDIPSFENETKPGTLTVSKEATGGTGDEVFTFEITLTDDYGRPLDNVSIIGAAE